MNQVTSLLEKENLGRFGLIGTTRSLILFSSIFTRTRGYVSQNLYKNV